MEAAINAARTYLPANLPANPTYRKVNPADAPIMILALTSNKYDPDKIYDEASTVMRAEAVADPGRGAGSVGGGALPSVRVEVNPTQLNSYGLTHGRRAVGVEPAEFRSGARADRRWDVTADIVTNDQISKAEDYKPLIIGYTMARRCGFPMWPT